MLALAAFYLARGIGLPLWRSWEPGDVTDIVVLTFIGAMLVGAKS